MTISEMLLPEYDQEMESTRKLLACVPEEKLSWKPHEKSMTLGRLASHVAEMPNWADSAIRLDKLEFGPEDKPLNAATKSELMAAFEKNAAAGHDAISSASDGHLAKTWELFFGGQKILSMPRAAVLRGLVMNHMIHHRGQLSVYLRLLDVAIPGMYGPSADQK